MEDELTLQEDTETGFTANDEMDPTSEMSDDDIAAALGFATTIGEQVMPQDDFEEEPAEEMEEAPEEPVMEEPVEEMVKEPLEEEVIEEPIETGPSETEQAILTKLDELDKKIEDVGKKTDVDKELERLEKELDALKKDAEGKD